MRFICTLFFLFPAFSVIVAQVSPNGLVACYKFDDVTDSYGNNDGTLAGNATTNGVLNIGSNASDVFFAPGSILNLSEFTFSVFVEFNGFNTNNESASNSIFTGASAADDNLLNFSYVKDQLSGGAATLSNTIFYIQDNQRYEFNNINLVTGTSYHFALVRSVDNLKLYINGVEQAPIGGISIVPISSTLESNGLTFGQDQDILAGGFADFQALNGTMDNVLVYNRPLSESEVNDVYEEETCGRYTSLVEQDVYSKFSVYPNPASDFVTIHSMNETQCSVKIYSFDGKVVYQDTGINQSYQKIDISELNAGTYIIELKDAHTGSTSFQKFVIQ